MIPAGPLGFGPVSVFVGLDGHASVQPVAEGPVLWRDGEGFARIREALPCGRCGGDTPGPSDPDACWYCRGYGSIGGPLRTVRVTAGPGVVVGGAA